MATAVVPAPPVITIPPFADQALLPACAAACGPLYDANGACVPNTLPADQSEQYTSCFCRHPAILPFTTGVSGVCDGACPDAAGMTSIMGWYQDICSVTVDDSTGGNDNNDNTDDNTGDDGRDNTDDSGSGDTEGDEDSTSGSGSGNKVGQSNGGDWLSNHWKWVVMLVVLVVGIAGIWIGACIWRRRYLRKKDRQSTLSQKQSGSVSHPSWGPGMAPSAPGSVANGNAPGVFMPETAVSATPFEEKPKKKKWLVSERT